MDYMPGRTRVAVIGLGYVGLPLIVEFGSAGFECVGIDLDPEKIRAVNMGKSYIPDVPSDDVDKLVKSKKLSATTDFTVLKDADAIIICVPTPLRKTKEPDISHILSACEHIARHLRRGQIIVLESTTYPGTTDEVILPMFEAKGLKVGEDFFLAFSPERVDPGNKSFYTGNIPKVVGGVTPQCTEHAVKLYSFAIKNIYPTSSARVAEAAKLLENTYRSVNIALVNEMALLCKHLGIDVWEVIAAAATKPFGYQAFYPGPGIGGHCIPLDPYYLTWRARVSGYEAKFISLAGEINSSMPHHVVTMVADALNEVSKPVNGTKILVIGVAYKKNVNDTRESPAIEIMENLAKRGAVLSYVDPYVPEFEAGGVKYKGVELTEATIRDSDLVLIVTDHSNIDYKLIGANAKLVVDTRNAMRDVEKPAGKVVKL
jgi:UDP-N-acetyl-D-glucosamine dehydrogenase